MCISLGIKQAQPHECRICWRGIVFEDDIRSDEMR